MKTSTRLNHAHCNPQRGAVAVMFGLSLVVLFGFIALVFDLGRTYVVRTELQNAADAAALAGAKDLNQKLDGVTKAIATAKAMGLQNNTKFSFKGNAGIVITDAMISVSDCPDDACTWTQASLITSANADGKTFLKVEIPSGGLATFFAVIAGNASTNTYGRAVAGRFVNDITPIGVCAIQIQIGSNKVSRPKGEALPGTNELAQFGFRQGVSYNIFELNPLGGPSDTYLLNPIDVYPNSCSASNSSANITAPFICSGSSAILNTTPGTVYGNTGISAGKIEAALNSRFNNYGGSSVCIPAQAPPDVNIRKYGCTVGGCVTPAADWMAPTNQTIYLKNGSGIPTVALPIPDGITSKNRYGVLWSYSRAVSADSSVTPPKPGAPFAATAADWATLYPAPGGAPSPNGNFPAVGSPYLDPGHSTPPVGNSGVLSRRVLNLVIADCPAITGTGICTKIPVLGIGRFFMQVPADFSGSPKKLEVEFAGLIEPIPTAEIKLYR
jgi:NAD(P)H-hydrate repair Nnr-like enzyme with NAD(P)H-hydrate epimerase domain